MSEVATYPHKESEMAIASAPVEMVPLASSNLWRSAMRLDSPKDIGGGCLVWWLEVTPEMALAALEWNTHNRPANPNRIAMYARDMSAGAWRSRNGTTIVFANTGELLDGQTRLQAIIKSGQSQRYLIMTGAELDAQNTVDGGRKRTFANQLALRGETNTSELAAACTYVYSYEVSASFRHTSSQPTPPQLDDVLARYPDLRDAMSPARRVHSHLRALRMSAGAAMFMLMARADPADASVFFSRLADGIGITSETDPLFLLRRSLMTESQSGRHRETPMFHRAGLTIKTFNAWRRGDSMRALVYRTGGAAAELFPLIDDLDLAVGHPRPDELHPRHRIDPCPLNVSDD